MANQRNRVQWLSSDGCGVVKLGEKCLFRQRKMGKTFKAISTTIQCQENKAIKNISFRTYSSHSCLDQYGQFYSTYKNNVTLTKNPLRWPLYWRVVNFELFMAIWLKVKQFNIGNKYWSFEV